jgi:isocitrate dehydrogenase
MFEAVHGSAPDIAGKDIANPSGLLAAAGQMLVHLGQHQTAERIENAWLSTLEAGVHTGDLFNASHSKRRVGTQEFAQAICDRLGETPSNLAPAMYSGSAITIPPNTRSERKRNKVLEGVDVFIDWDEGKRQANELAAGLVAAGDMWRLKMITNRGVKVWPDGLPETFCTDHWRCRFMPTSNQPLTNADIVTLLSNLHRVGFDVIKTENLYRFGEERGYSLGQGE